MIAYSTSLGNGFVWDDFKQIVMNPDLKASAPWGSLFSSDVWGHAHRDRPAQTNYYRPLQMVSYRMTSELFGLEARDLHILSVALALVAALTALVVYLKLTGRLAKAFVAAALFAIHPVHSEAVDWISALPEIGCTIFVLAAFGLFLRICDQESCMMPAGTSGQRPWALWCLTLLMFAVALLWKETAVVFPIVVAGYIFCAKSGTLGQRLRWSARLSLPFWGVLVAYLALRLRVLGFVAARQRIWDLSPFQVTLNSFYLMAAYWWKLVVPVHLNAYYVFSPVRSILEPRAILGILFVAISCLAMCYGLRRSPLVTFGALWVFVTLLPVMDIYALGRNVFAERYLYLPSFGACLLAAGTAGAAMKRLPEKVQRPISALLLVGVLGWFSAETLRRNPDWRDDATLFRQTLVSSPNAPFVHFMVASTEGDDSVSAGSAEAHYLRAVDLAESENPPDLLDVSRAYGGLSSLYADRGDYVHALEILHRWRSIVPGQPEMDIDEGTVLLRTGNWREAEPLLNRALAASPQNENVLSALGLLAWQYKQNPREAIDLFNRALAIHTAKDSFQASLHNNLGSVYGDLGQFAAALEQFQSAVATTPGDAEYHTNLATALAALQRYDEATAEANRALRIDANYAPARALLRELDTRAGHER